MCITVYKGATLGGRKQRGAELSKAAYAMQQGQARALDSLAEYDSFREMFLPEIRKALLEGLNSEQILAKFKPIMAARLVQIGAVGGETAALGAIKELIDRTDGKAVQKQELTHRLAKLPDNELDAVLATKLAKLKDIEVTATSVTEEESEE